MAFNQRTLEGLKGNGAPSSLNLEKQGDTHREVNLCPYTSKHTFLVFQFQGILRKQNFLTFGVSASFSLAERCFSGPSRCLWTVRRPPSPHQWTGHCWPGAHRHAGAAHWKTDEDPCCGKNGRTPPAQNLRGSHGRSRSAVSCFGSGFQRNQSDYCLLG